MKSITAEQEEDLEIVLKIFTMITAIASDGNNLHSSVAEKFTRAWFMIFYNREKQQEEYKL